jgi:hypothetical protein
MGNIENFINSKDEQFNFKPCVIAGDDCWLITPVDMGVKWDDDNFRFRSCIVRQSDNFVVSQGFGKFVNWGERPDFQTWDENAPFEARHKLDGSLLIVSKYKGELILRTRGTTDARQMANGHEIDYLITKYDKFFEIMRTCPDTHNNTYLFEWTTPSNIIVLREHEEPTLTLVGAVTNDHCIYATQFWLDAFAKEYVLNRPQKYEYATVAECLADVAAWTGKEGVVLYQGQKMKKIKGDEYCELHKLATGIKGVKQVLDVFMASPKFLHDDEFYKYIETTLDFEIAEKCKDFIKEVCEAYYDVWTWMNTIKDILNLHVRCLETRKEQALQIQHAFSVDWRKQMAFVLLDNREIEDKLIKKAMMDLLNI